MNDHRDIMGGDGTRERPLLVAPITYYGSTVAQRETIRQIYGYGAYQVDGPRRYYESLRGKARNQDLCEHILLVNGRNLSIWFDLSEVTKFSESPKNRELVERDNTRQMFGLPPQHWLGPPHSASPTITASCAKGEIGINSVGAQDEMRRGLPPSKSKRMKTLWTLLKPCVYVLLTVWACSQYGWLGLLAVPAVAWLTKTMNAFDNWRNHWAGTPTSSALALASSVTSSPVPQQKPTPSQNLLASQIETRLRRHLLVVGRTGTEPDAQEYAADWVMRTQLGLVPDTAQNQPRDASATFYRRADAPTTKSGASSHSQILPNSIDWALKN